MELIHNELTIHHRGPPLTSGPLPALFYLALSGRDSLHLDPYCQPVDFLCELHNVHVFSFDLPAHSHGVPPAEAMSSWIRDIESGGHAINTFIELAQSNMHYLIEQKIVDPKRLAVAGLSRGGLIATLLAEREQRLSHLVGFAPLTNLSLIKEFRHLEDQISLFSLKPNPHSLIHTQISFYIGNRDIRVSTDACYALVRAIIENAAANRLRSPAIELHLHRSIGHKGHGTPKEVFHQGMKWLLSSCFFPQ